MNFDPLSEGGAGGGALRGAHSSLTPGPRLAFRGRRSSRSRRKGERGWQPPPTEAGRIPPVALDISFDSASYDLSMFRHLSCSNSCCMIYTRLHLNILEHVISFLRYR